MRNETKEIHKVKKNNLSIFYNMDINYICTQKACARLMSLQNK